MIRKALLVSITCLLGAGALAAQPRLELRIPTNLTRPIWAPTGTNGPDALFFEAFNAGSGSLTVEADGSFAPWLTPQVAAGIPCSFDGSITCFRVAVRFNASSLEAGEYSGRVRVTAADAIDAPQNLEVTLLVGGDIPSEVELYVPPVAGASDFVDFRTTEGMSPTMTTAGDFLRVSSSGQGSFRFVHNHRLVGSYQSGLANGPNRGTVFVSGSPFAGDNGSFPVNLNVTTQPIAAPSATRLVLETAEGKPARDQVLALSNRGQGTLSVSDAAVSTDSGGDWLSAEVLENNLVAVRADTDGVAPGLYRGALLVESNAANSPTRLEVVLSVQPLTGPVAAYRGAVNGATFDSTRPVSPGSIISLFGEQLSFELEQAEAVPLPRELGGTKVTVNGVEAPLFFVSYGQINLQVPFGTQSGSARIQVTRDGMEGNQIMAQVDSRTPGIFRLNIGEYGAIVNASQGNLPLPVRIGEELGIATAPARPGDVLLIYATGLGPVSPEIGTGEAPPSDRLVTATDVPIVNFGRLSFGPLENPQFVGLAPGFVGLFQLNVSVPSQAATNERTWVTLEYPDGRRSNPVEIAVEAP